MHRNIHRRTVLRGTGVALALPLLHAMGRQASCSTIASTSGTPGSNDGMPTRMAALFFPNGVREDCWTPDGQGAEWELPSQLEPLADLKDKVSVISGLWHQATNTGDGHYVKDAAWLTGTTIRKTTGVDLNSGGISVDQLAARHLGRQTPLPSLELGIEPVRSGVDGVVGYTRVYGAHIAWKSPTQPLAKEINPRQVFDRMTRIASGGQRQVATQRVIDLVREDANRLMGRLGNDDRHRLDQYLESVHALETQMQRIESDESDWVSRVDFSMRNPPEENPTLHADRVRLMLDMIALAFESDITRVITFMFGNSVSGTNYSFLDGVNDSHHELSHHQNKPEKLAQYELVTRWHVAQYAYLLEKLASIPEGDSNVLENSALLFGSALRDGNKHSPRDLPLLLAGSAGGTLRTGLHVACTKDNPMANLLLTLLQSTGVDASHFADSTGPIAELLS